MAKMRSKMTKMRVSRVMGVENLKPMVVSLKLGVLAMLKAEGLSHWKVRVVPA